MRNFTEQTLTDAVLKQIDNAPDPRLRQIMGSLVRHLHAFAREVELTEAEWFAGIRFLTATGQACTDLRQEFILLSDTLGLSMLVDTIGHRDTNGATASTVLGPFYREGAPPLPAGANIAGDTPGDACFVSGRITDTAGKPIAGALLDIWHAGPDGLYDNQYAGPPTVNLRGRLRTDGEGRYAFRTVKPAFYGIPMDGPVGAMMRALNRHPYRPAHIHFMLTAEGYTPLTTHIFVNGDRYLDSDAVFVVKDSLIADFVRHDSKEEAARRATTAPFWTVEYDFALKAA